MSNDSFKSPIEALSKISEAVASERYLEDILRLIVTVTAQVMGSKICSLMLIDSSKKHIVIRATQSISEEYIKKNPLGLDEGITGKVIKTGKPATVKNVTLEKEYKYQDIAKSEGLCSLLCVPLTVKGTVIGALNSYTQIPHDFTSTEIGILTTVANQAAIAIENAELITKSQALKEELESRKIVERAKGILMKDGLSEEEAYQRIKKYAMDNRRTMKEVAEALILTVEIKRDVKD